VDEQAITVVFAADDNYSRPLATAARSVIATLRPDRRLQLCVLDMGIGLSNRRLIEATFEHPLVDLVWIDSLRERVADLPNPWTAITRATYARLWIPTVLPESVERALYLDCDVIARRCVGDLFCSDMKGAAALATPDVQSPFVSSTYAVPYWFERGRRADDLNFNAGVMLMDLTAFRAERVTEAALEYLSDGRHYFAQDQEALNSVLAGRIGEMDPRWNQQSEIFLKQYEVILPFSQELREQLMANPWITHYSNQKKPWHAGLQHPLVHEWFEHLDQTAYAGWRPPGPTRRQRATQHARVIVRKVGRKLGLLSTS
jgi:lipopolysaccharide biosynthesis glycosyltransferase